jgi:hypothetical protein
LAFFDRLCGQLWRCSIKQAIGARRFEADDLRVNSRVSNLIGHVGNDLCLVVESVLQPLEVILAEMIILIKNADFSLRMVVQQILGVDARFLWKFGCQPMVQGKWRGSFHFVAP